MVLTHYLFCQAKSNMTRGPRDRAKVSGDNHKTAPASAISLGSRQLSQRNQGRFKELGMFYKIKSPYCSMGYRFNLHLCLVGYIARLLLVFNPHPNCIPDLERVQIRENIIKRPLNW